MGVAEYIQVAIFFALVWYSLETKGLRKWQKKSYQLQYLQTSLDIAYDHERIGRGNKSVYLNELIRVHQKGKIEIENLYSKGVVQKK